MNTHIIFLSPTTGPLLTIVGLLLVAGLIGYVTAWYYAKSVYVPVIRGLEEDKARLNSEVSMLNDDIKQLNNKIDSLGSEILKLGEEVAEKEKIISEKQDEINNLKGK